MVKKEFEAYPFHKANIHERRFVAVFFRALPLLTIVCTCATLVYGALSDEFVLLLISALLNTAMWLWIVTTSIYGMAGSWKVMTEVQTKAVELEAKADPSESLCTDRVDTDQVSHLIVLPNYKEDESILSETLACLAEAEDSKSFYVAMAMEAREGEDGGTKAERLQQRFAKCFGNIFITIHPSDLNEEHLDDSIDLEVPGKASNLKWAVQSAYNHIIKLGLTNIENVLLTVADADCLFHPCYFSSITQDFNSLREKPPSYGGMKEHQWSMWQAPQLSFRDHWKAPLCSRAWTYVSSMYEFGGTSSLEWGGHHMVFSGYTLPLQLALHAQTWEGDVIAEDHHAYLKCLFYSAYSSAEQCTSGSLWYDPIFGDGCQPLLQVRPVFLPVKSAPVISDEGYWQTYVERWHQAKRHAQGVAELPYALLVCWDICCTLPLGCWSARLIYKLGRVLTRLFCMHILPTCQAVALATMTLYWFYMQKSLKMCPETLTIADFRAKYALCGCAGAWALVWPMAIPLMCVVLANFFFLLTGFLQPATMSIAGRSSWHVEDGSIATICGSKKIAALATISIDCFLFLSIIMVPYGFVAVMLAYWNVCFYGNRFKYVTAAKAAKTTTDYGSMSEKV